MQTVAGLVRTWGNGSNCRIDCRIGEGDLNTELLTAWIKRIQRQDWIKHGERCLHILGSVVSWLSSVQHGRM